MISVNTMVEGDSFGEIALQDDDVRTATIRCQSESVELVTLQKDDFKEVISVALNYQRELRTDYIQSAGLFRKIERDELKMLARMCQERKFLCG